jgi:hypothetical protein
MGVSTLAAGGGHPCAIIHMDGHFLSAAGESQRLVAVATLLRRARELSFMQRGIRAGDHLTMRASGTWKYLARWVPGAAGASAIVHGAFRPGGLRPRLRPVAFSQCPSPWTSPVDSELP